MSKLFLVLKAVLSFGVLPLIRWFRKKKRTFKVDIDSDGQADIFISFDQKGERKDDRSDPRTP